MIEDVDGFSFVIPSFFHYFFLIGGFEYHVVCFLCHFLCCTCLSGCIYLLYQVVKGVGGKENLKAVILQFLYVHVLLANWLPPLKQFSFKTRCWALLLLFYLKFCFCMFKCKSSSPYQILIMKIKFCNKIIVNKTNTSANADFFTIIQQSSCKSCLFCIFFYI